MTEFALIPGTIPASKNAYPAHPQQLMEMFAEYLAVQMSESLSFFNYGEATPPPDRQDRPWIRTIGGKPAGIWIFYGGSWVRDWGVPIGTTMPIKDYTAPVFDNTGKATDSGWVGWYLANGQNGTDDLRDKFIYGYGPGGVSTLDAISGAAEITLDADQIPSLQGTLAARAVKPDSASPSVVDFVPQVGADKRAGVVFFDNSDQQTVGILPPNVAKGYVQYMGYA